MKQVKRNKKRVWRKTYGKPFIVRKALWIARATVSAAQASLKIHTTSNAFTGLALASLAGAQAILALAKAVGDSSHEMNKGFINKEFES